MPPPSGSSSRHRLTRTGPAASASHSPALERLRLSPLTPSGCPAMGAASAPAGTMATPTTTAGPSPAARMAARAP